ncbi:MAG: hypothetical protein LR015_08335 [Verrucomicrobia bacterium]|nr:hypothetical protein [Verrucomicrobiota bacterium]
MTLDSANPSATQSLARILVRLVAFMLVLIGLWGLTVNVVESLPGFDPNFPGYYFWSEIFRPASLAFLGIILWLTAHPVSQRICR